MTQALPWMLGIALVAASCRAEAVCPFLNSATAGGILGGKVTVSVVGRNGKNDDAACEFARESHDAPSVLRIEVKTMNNWRAEFPPFLAQCGPNAVALRGIGNAAVGCSGTAKNGTLYDQVLSRVRERSLLVRLTVGDKHAGVTSLREQSIQTAEEVAGNLF